MLRRAGCSADTHAQGVTSEGSDVIDYRQMCQDVSAQLWAVYHDRPDAPRLILPLKRDGIRRVSEQESKILITQWLEDHGQNYSIETPTGGMYQQSGQAEMSARIDVTAYGSRDARDRVMNMELKAGTATLEAFRKDFEKLLREQVPGLWFHTLECANDAAWVVLEQKMAEALFRLSLHADAANHRIAFAFCVLNPPSLVEFELDFAVPWRDQLHVAMQEGRRSQVRSTWSPSGRPPQQRAKRVDPSYSGGSGKLLVYIPTIDARTFLHLSTKGESYALRSFAGARGYSRWTEAGLGTTSQLLAAHPVAVSIDVAGERKNLEGEKQYWVERITVLNHVHGIG